MLSFIPISACREHWGCTPHNFCLHNLWFLMMPPWWTHVFLPLALSFVFFSFSAAFVAFHNRHLQHPFLYALFYVLSLISLCSLCYSCALSVLSPFFCYLLEALSPWCSRILFRCHRSLSLSLSISISIYISISLSLYLFFFLAGKRQSKSNN